MATVWITYAWVDNGERDVDFIAQELQRSGLTVKLDRWNLSAGGRLWDQIANFIVNPQESDAWLLYATQNGLASQRCREELAYALDRALENRGREFPVIAVFPSSVERSLIPPSIRVRLFVSLADADWKERIVAAAEGRPVAVSSTPVQPFVARWHRAPDPFQYALEFRPRAGVWNPFIFAIPVDQKDHVAMTLRSGPPGRVPAIAGVVMSRGEGITPDGLWYYELGYEPASPTNSYYAFVREMPSTLAFGQEGSPGQVWLFEGARLEGMPAIQER